MTSSLVNATFYVGVLLEMSTIHAVGMSLPSCRSDGYTWLHVTCQVHLTGGFEPYE